VGLKLKTGSALSGSGLGLGLGNGHAYAAAGLLGSMLGAALLVTGGVLLVGWLLAPRKEPQKTQG